MSNMTIATGTIEYPNEAEENFFKNLPPIPVEQPHAVSALPTVAPEVTAQEVAVPAATIPDDIKDELIAQARKVGAGYKLETPQSIDREALQAVSDKLNGKPLED